MENGFPRWVIVCMLLRVGVIAGGSKDPFANINCPSPQYVVLGTTGRLDCNFPHRFTAVYWKYEHGDETISLVGLEGTVKRGRSYENGTHDIHSDGSLIIKEVGVEDEGVYLVMLVTSEDNVKHLRITLVATDDFANINCSSPQYVVLGRTGRFNCNFPRRFTAVYWSYEHGDETISLVGLEGTVKRGRGYENGTHDIHSDGSLIINEVEVEDGGVYMVILVTSEDKVKYFRITLETTGYNRSPFDDFHCESPQYLTLGRAGQLYCIFPETFNAVIWKKEINGRPYSLMAQEYSVKKGQGFIDGRYDMHPDGSLIIHMVNATNDGIYKVTLITAEDNISHARVTLVTTVLSQQNHPYINLCGKDDHCFRRYDPGTTIYCSYNHSRPAVNLNWYIRHPSNDTSLQASLNNEADLNEAFSSISRLDITDLASGRFVFLVCVAGGPPLTPHTIESWLILDTSQKIYESLNDVSISNMDVPLYGHSVLPCEIQPTLGAVVWLSVDLTGLTSTLVYSMYYTPQRRYYTYSNIYFDEKSTAIELFRVTRENERRYVCLSIDGTHTEVMAAYQLAVFVTPSPPYIKVDACFKDRADCQLSSQNGTLSCCISRVYNVELEAYVRDKSKISTSNEKQSRQSIGGGFVDRCVTFDYELHQDVCEYPVSVFCYARTEGGLEIVPRREITFMNQEKCQSYILSTHTVITISIWIALAAIIAILVISNVYLWKRKRETKSSLPNSHKGK